MWDLGGKRQWQNICIDVLAKRGGRCNSECELISKSVVYRCVTCGTWGIMISCTTQAQPQNNTN